MKDKTKFLYIFPLIAAILFFVGLRFYNPLYNSPFLDEAIYIVIGKNVLENPFPNLFPLNWVGGAPFLFPFLSAASYELFGILGSRILVALLGTASLYFMYRVGFNLFYTQEKKFSQLTGITAALFLSASSVHLWLSRIAIYDMLAFLFLIAGFSFALDAFIEKNKRKYFISSLLLAFSFFSKYSTIIILPFLIIILFANAYLHNRGELKNISFWGINTALIIAAYVAIFFQEVYIFFTQQAVATGQTEAFSVFMSFLEIAGIWYLIAILALIWNIISRNNYVIMLFVFSLVPPVANIIARNTTTIEQNALYSLLLIIPLAASIPAFIIVKKKIFGIILNIAIVAFVAYFFSLPQLYSLTHFWPNTNEAMNTLQENVGSEDLILAESGDVAVLALEEIVPPGQITGPYVFGYEGSEGTEAYRQAIEDGHFSYIQIESVNGGFYESVAPPLENNYQVIYEEDNMRVYEAI